MMEEPTIKKGELKIESIKHSELKGVEACSITRIPLK